MTVAASSFLRPLGETGLTISALGLGTVKIGRNQQVKYPEAFDLPDDTSVRNLLAQARELGINLLDTAPAYGSSEERLGQLLTTRDKWVIATKVGEEFSDGKSSFDFSARHVRMSIERSLKRLNTDYLDLVMIHSDGNDYQILQQTDCLEALQQCQQAGLIRATGMSVKTEEGGILAAQHLDVLMLTWNLTQQDRQSLAAATRLNRGVLVKKGLMSGHLKNTHSTDQQHDSVQQSMACSFSEPGIHSMIVGTINPAHLQSNVEAAKAVLEVSGSA